MRSRLATLILAAAGLLAYPGAGSAALGAGSAAPTAGSAAASAGTAAASPITRHKRPAQLVARYVGTPTAFAFSPRRVFMSDGTRHPRGIGGVYVLGHGTARRLANSPHFSFGLAWHHHALFISAGRELLVWRGWNGRRFARQRTIYTAPPGFTGFNGLAFAPNGRLYVGVDVGAHNDHGPASAPYQYDVLSMTPRGTHVKIIARGIRQPWQLAFPPGSRSPFVTDLGQDRAARHPPDLLLRVRKGQDYGFPTCNWTRATFCQGYARPVRSFAPHSDPMGLGIVAGRVFISEFGVRTPAQVISVPEDGGGTARVELSGFSRGRNIVGLGANAGWVYVGEIAASKQRLGSVWRFRP